MKLRKSTIIHKKELKDIIKISMEIIFKRFVQIEIYMHILIYMKSHKSY